LPLPEISVVCPTSTPDVGYGIVGARRAVERDAKIAGSGLGLGERWSSGAEENGWENNAI
jgi:hypothetical protein